MQISVWPGTRRTTSTGRSSLVAASAATQSNNQPTPSVEARWRGCWSTMCHGNHQECRRGHNHWPIQTHQVDFPVAWMAASATGAASSGTKVVNASSGSNNGGGVAFGGLCHAVKTGVCGKELFCVVPTPTIGGDVAPTFGKRHIRCRTPLKAIATPVVAMVSTAVIFPVCR